MPDSLQASDLQTQGLITGSVTRTTDTIAFNSYRLMFRNIDTGSTFRIYVTADPMDGTYQDDIIEPASRGSHFALLLPPGRYELYDYTLSAEQPGGTFVVKPKSEFSIPFLVERGKIHYIGDFNCQSHTSIQESLGFKFTHITGGTWTMQDRSARDLAAMATRYPGLDWKAAQSEVLNPAPSLRLLIRRE
jgi:hypothetical protein